MTFNIYSLYPDNYDIHIGSDLRQKWARSGSGQKYFERICESAFHFLYF